MASVVLLFAAPSGARIHSSASGDATPATCDQLRLTHHLHRARVLFRSAYDLERWASGPKRSEIRAAQDHKQCIRVKKTRGQIGEYRKRLVAKFERYRAEQRQVASLTPYPGPGGTNWAIPWYVVSCESHGNWGAYNASSGATGPYQMLPSTYGSVCRSCDWSKFDQHYAAGRVWDRSGGSEWVCA